MIVGAVLVSPTLPTQTLTSTVMVSFVGVAISLIAMIVHLHATRQISDEEKMEWRGRLWWGGPLVAASYLWSMSDRPAAAPGRTTRLGPITGPERSLHLSTIGLVVSITVTFALAAQYTVPAGGTLLALAFQRALPIFGSAIGSIIVTTFLRPHVWPRLAYLLAPSWIVVAWQNLDNVEALIGLAMASVFVAWLASRAVQSYLSQQN